jgi:hypothetical protein
MIGLEKEFPFCSNPDCELYVRADAFRSAIA